MLIEFITRKTHQLYRLSYREYGSWGVSLCLTPAYIKQERIKTLTGLLNERRPDRQVKVKNAYLSNGYPSIEIEVMGRGKDKVVAVGDVPVYAWPEGYGDYP